MGDTFLINVNCSKILPDTGATHYTMFIDSSKMSIVYELVEWIRWMFSLENCIYLKHEDSVIHELEDIQLLSKLKHFEIIPCGQFHCVHKKNYRALLKNLNLIVSWNETKVHKYFLDKINQMRQKLSQNSTKAYDHTTCSNVQENYTISNTSTDASLKINSEESKLHLCENQQSDTSSGDVPAHKKTQMIGNCSKSTVNGESPCRTNSFLDKMGTEKDNFLIQLGKNFNLSSVSNNSASQSLEAKKPDNLNFSTSSSCDDLAKKEMKSDKGGMKNNAKPKSVHKFTRPFSLGEILTNIREDFERRNGETPTKENVSQDKTDSLLTEERNSDKEITAFENSLLMQDKVTGDRKRQRTRKRKRSKKQNVEDDGFTSFMLEKKRGLCSLNVPKGNSNTKPNHIRFDADDYEMEFESAKEYESISKDVDSSNTAEFLKNGPDELLSVINGNSQGFPDKSVQNTPDKNVNLLECSSPSVNQVTEEKLIDLPSEPCENVNQSFSPLENLELNSFNQDMNDLLSIRDKFKRGIVIQRFY